MTFDHTDPANVFYVELQPISDQFVSSAIKIGKLLDFDESQEDPTGALRHEWMIDHGVVPGWAMQSFADFVQRHKNLTGARPVFMAFPASFDWTFVYWYFQNFGVRSPFGFSSVIDLKTYYAAWKRTPLTKSTKRYMDKRVFSKLPHTHFADDDAIEQGIMGMNIMKFAHAERTK